MKAFIDWCVVLWEYIADTKGTLTTFWGTFDFMGEQSNLKAVH